MTVRPRAAVAAITPYVPGRPAPAIPGALKLASNENPLGPSPRAVAAISAAASAVGRYPDRDAVALRDAVAAQHGLRREHVLVGNGSDDLIHLLAASYLEPGRTVVLADPPYSIQRIAAESAGATVVRVPLRDATHDLAAMTAAAVPDGWVAVTNPHNPTGTAVAPGDLAGFVDGLPRDVLVLVDEAYHHFADAAHRCSAIDLLPRHPGLVVLRTFS
jgi:histidinol-phosphate aminotransferase